MRPGALFAVQIDRCQERNARTVTSCVGQWLRKHLLCTNSIEVARKLSSPYVAEVCAGHRLRIKIMRAFVSSSRAVTSPCDSICFAQRKSEMRKRQKREARR